MINQRLQRQEARVVILQHRTHVFTLHVRQRDQLPAARPVGGPVAGLSPFPTLGGGGGERAGRGGAGAGRVRADCVSEEGRSLMF